MYYHTKIYLLDNLRGLLPFPMVPMGLFSPRCPILMKLTADHYSRAVDNLGEWMDFKEDEGISLLINMPDVFSSQAGHFFFFARLQKLDLSSREKSLNFKNF